MLRSPLLHFVCLGTLIFVLEAAWSRGPDTPVVEVSSDEIAIRLEAYALQMNRAPTEPERRAIESQVIDDAVWLEQAFALGLAEFDPVVHQRLVLNMRFLEDASSPSSDGGDPASPAESERELIARAIELGMDRSDTVIQRRLIDRVQAIIRERVRTRPIEAETLRTYFEENAERWRQPALLDLSHVYLSRDKRGDAASAQAEALRARFAGDGTDAEAAVLEGDPFLAGHRLRGATPARVVARLGPTFAEGVESAPVAQWVGPVESAFGMHVVWIHDRKSSRIPKLDEIEERVREDFIEEQSRKALREFVTKRRDSVEIRFISDAA